MRVLPCHKSGGSCTFNLAQMNLATEARVSAAATKRRENIQCEMPGFLQRVRDETEGGGGGGFELIGASSIDARALNVAVQQIKSNRTVKGK